MQLHNFHDFSKCTEKLCILYYLHHWLAFFIDILNEIYWFFHILTNYFSSRFLKGVC